MSVIDKNSSNSASTPAAELIINNPGVLALIQDAGRFGQHRIGLTVGGPLDPFAFRWANRLCHNPDNSSAIEITVGGFSATVTNATQIAITGATVDVSVNGHAMPMWQTLSLAAGDNLKIGFASLGCRIYLALQGGLQVAPQFGSTATVVREAIGGVNGGALAKGERLDLSPQVTQPRLMMPTQWQPNYAEDTPLHVVLGYQEASFSASSKAHFFSSDYTVSERTDRMGYRLTGPECHSSVSNMLSEGICHGAIQVPPDGQPIVLLNDRQTIGGYPKLGSVMARDTARLAQMTQGKSVCFSPVTIEQAHAINIVDKHKQSAIVLTHID